MAVAGQRGGSRLVVIGSDQFALNAYLREDVVYDFDNGRIAAANAAYGALCAELEIPFLDLFTPLSALDGWMGLIADGVHPGGVGYDRITDLVEAWAPWRAWMD